MIGIPKYVSSNCSKVFPTLEDFKEKLELVENKFQGRELYNFFLKKDNNSKVLNLLIKTFEIEGENLFISRNKSFSKAYNIDRIITDFYEDSFFYIIAHEENNVIILSYRSTTYDSYFENNKAVLCTLRNYEKQVFYKTNPILFSSKYSTKSPSWFCLDTFYIDKYLIDKTTKKKGNVLLGLNEQRFYDKSQLKPGNISIPVYIDEKTFEPIVSKEEVIELENHIFLSSKDYEIIPLSPIRSGKTYKRVTAFNEIFNSYQRHSDTSECFSLILKTKNKHIIL